MARFNYVATNHEGKAQQGVIEAGSRDEAIAMITRQQLRPVMVKAAGGKEIHIKFGQHVPLKELVIFNRQLSVMITAGVPLARAMGTLQAQTKNKYFN